MIGPENPLPEPAFPAPFSFYEKTVKMLDSGGAWTYNMGLKNRVPGGRRLSNRCTSGSSARSVF